MRNKHIRRFDRCNKASVKADERKLIRHLIIYRCKRSVYFLKRQRIVLVKFVEAHAAYTSSAVIPEDKPHFSRRIVFYTPAEKIDKHILLAHIDRFFFFDKAYFSARYNITLCLFGRDAVCIRPRSGTARLNDELHVLAF